MRSHSSGFTLVELITVITIIGVLAVVVGPRFASTDVFDERTFFDDVAQAVRFAQAKALGSGCITQVQFSGSGFSVTVDSDCNSAAFSGAAVVNPDGFDSSYTELSPLPAGVSYSATVNPLLFDPQGRAMNSGLAIFSGEAVISVGARELRVVGETGYVYQP
ncbi:GspH/FimT family pseudopilin [Ketobacter sp.]|uniref:GspH/FimT family pseudopilin n=1 Tax=Ketobacter sp. TaxID=2083498 RepID=UPI000F2BC6A0|nr:GspH/FimT family pseudopilin [Ketobacter sp.]RLU01868.1 MAG: prepilin-type N-terminal cleavage/methylation domain-containing protein [Ketobacter sp.]